MPATDSDFDILVVDERSCGVLVAYQRPKKPNPSEWIGAFLLILGFWWVVFGK